MSGFLVPAGNEDALVRALERALSDEIDVQARTRSRERIVQDADRHTNLARIVDWWRDLARHGASRDAASCTTVAPPNT